MKSIIRIVALLVVLSMCGLISLYIFQNKLLYPAPNQKVLKYLPENVSRIDLGLSYAYLLKPTKPTNEPFPLLIFSHGNAELADRWISRLDYILNQGIAVLLVEYPGYGESQAETSLRTINTTMLNAFDKAVTLPYINKNLVIAYGRSIGGGAASLLAAQRPLIALALESTFSDLPKLISEKSLPDFLLKDQYNNQKIVESLNIPIFIYHGIYDVVIPISHAQSLIKAGKDITFYSEKCGHNNCPRKWKELINFLQDKTDFSLKKPPPF